MTSPQQQVIRGPSTTTNMAPPQVQRTFTPPGSSNPMGSAGPAGAMGGPAGFQGGGNMAGMLGGLPGWTGSSGGGYSFNPITGQFEMREGDDTGAYGHQMNAISAILNQMMGTGAQNYGTQAGFLGNLYNTAMSPVLAEIAQTPALLAQQRFDKSFPAVFGSMGDYFKGSAGFGNPGMETPQWEQTQHQFPDRPQAPTLPSSPFQGLPGMM